MDLRCWYFIERWWRDFLTSDGSCIWRLALVMQATLSFFIYCWVSFAHLWFGISASLSLTGLFSVSSLGLACQDLVVAWVLSACSSAVCFILNRRGCFGPCGGGLGVPSVSMPLPLSHSTPTLPFPGEALLYSPAIWRTREMVLNYISVVVSRVCHSLEPGLTRSWVAQKKWTWMKLRF